MNSLCSLDQGAPLSHRIVWGNLSVWDAMVGKAALWGMWDMKWHYNSAGCHRAS